MYEQTVSNLDGTICIPCAGTTITPVNIAFTSITTTYCEGAITDALPTVDENGITGAWTPSAIDNTTSGNYIFVPDATQCANSFVINVTITPECDATCATTQACDDGDACTENDMETVGSNGGVCVACAGTPISTVVILEDNFVCSDDVNIMSYDLTGLEPIGSMGTWDGVTDPTSVDVSTGGTFIYNYTGGNGCARSLQITINILDEIQITAIPTCDAADEGSFFIEVQDITGGSQVNNYTVEANGLTVNYAGGSVAIGPFTYIDHNTGITLNITSSIGGCTATYDVLQLNCADQHKPPPMATVTAWYMLWSIMTTAIWWKGSMIQVSSPI